VGGGNRVLKGEIGGNCETSSFIICAEIEKGRGHFSDILEGGKSSWIRNKLVVNVWAVVNTVVSLLVR
jgi:hypothetical protein